MALSLTRQTKLMQTLLENAIEQNYARLLLDTKVDPKISLEAATKGWVNTENKIYFPEITLPKAEQELMNTGEHYHSINIVTNAQYEQPGIIKLSHVKGAPHYAIASRQAIGKVYNGKDEVTNSNFVTQLRIFGIDQLEDAAEMYFKLFGKSQDFNELFEQAIDIYEKQDLASKLR